MRNIPFTRSSKLSEDLGTSEMPEKVLMIKLY